MVEIVNHGIFLGTKAARLALLDGEGRVLDRATGCLVEEADGVYLYATWHAVTGRDFVRPEIARTPPPAAVGIECLDSRARASALFNLLGETEVVALYDAGGRPAWTQEAAERPHPALAGGEPRCPATVDLVALKIEIGSAEKATHSIGRGLVMKYTPEVGARITVVGFPHGYGAIFADSSAPVFLERGIVANRLLGPGAILCEGGCPRGLPGAPVFVNHLGKWWLYGIYAGDFAADGEARTGANGNGGASSLGLILDLLHARGLLQGKVE